MKPNPQPELRMAPVLLLKSKGNPDSYVNYLVLDWSNVVHRAVSVAGAEKFIELLASMLVNYRRRFHQWKFCFALDSPGGVEVRRALMPTYKHNRMNKPEEDVIRYRSCMERSLELLTHLDGIVAQCAQGEADDVIASFIRQSKRGRRFVIVTEDRDLWQLISPTVTVWTRQNQEINQESCIRSFGALPNRVPMIKALLGDPADSIPRGVERVKKEVLLRIARSLRTPGGIEQALQSADWLEAQDQQRLRDGWPKVLQNYSIIKLRTDLPLSLRALKPNASNAAHFLEQHHAGLMRQELSLLVAAPNR